MTADDLVVGGAGQTPLHPDDLEGLRPRWIRTQGPLDELERENLLRGTRWAFARARPLARILDDTFLRELHARCFGDVWSWAGSYRRRATSIGIDPPRIATEVRDLLADARVWLADAADAAAVRSDLARLHHRLVAIHPFPNGTGRTCRLYVDLVARTIGAPLPGWGDGRDDARSAYLDALRAADDGDLAPLVAFMWS